MRKLWALYAIPAALIVGGILIWFEAKQLPTVAMMSLIVVLVVTGIGFVFGIVSFQLKAYQAIKRGEEEYAEMSTDWWSDFWKGASTEMIGAVITAVLFTLIVGFAESAENDRALQERLLREARSQVKAVAVAAIEEIMATDIDWLQGANLTGANLPRVYLYDSNLQDSNLSEISLEDAILSFANLKNAQLARAKLQGAVLAYSVLQDAILTDANLENTDLWSANLKGADLSGAYLKGADFTDYQSNSHLSVDSNTILPDGSRYNPLQDLRQFERFINPEHPDYWEPEWVTDEDEADEE